MNLVFDVLFTDLGYTSSWNRCQRRIQQWNGRMWTSRNCLWTLSSRRQSNQWDLSRQVLVYGHIGRRSIRRAIHQPLHQWRIPIGRSLAAQHCRTPIPTEIVKGSSCQLFKSFNNLGSYLGGDGCIWDFVWVKFPTIIAWNRLPVWIGRLDSGSKYLRKIHSIHETFAMDLIGLPRNP